MVGTTRTDEDRESPPRGYQADGGLVPVPDPTLLTTQLVDKAIKSLEAKLQTRFDAMDKAADLLHADYTRVPTEMDRQIGHLRELLLSNIDTLAKQLETLTEVTDERFGGIAIQFQERDKRTEQLSLADKTAIAAALQAQKEAAGATNDSNAAAITKSEAAFTKQIDQIGTLLQTMAKSIDDKINDMKGRLDKGEGTVKGGGEAWSYMLALGGFAFGGTMAVVALLKLTGHA